MQMTRTTPQKLSILGATGSIGSSTLDVVAQHPERYQVVALTTHTRVDTLIAQARQCQPDYLVVADQASYPKARELAAQAGVKAELLCGPEALRQVASLPEVDTVMAAIVGAAGLLPTLAAVQAGKKVLLANKESLVMSGQCFIDQARASGALVLPIDSEHNAIFQCLPASFEYAQLAAAGVSKILLTGSGGPFLSMPLEQLAHVTPDQACAHPNWVMGRKISVDSATMMNKGLEFIEACWLFGAKPSDIQVVVHPQSVIHSMVQYVDGSVLAQMGNPDMRTPIAHCLAYPERTSAGVAPLDFANLTEFSFHTPDFQRFPNLKLAIQACEAGQYATTSLNAGNEVAVAAFLAGRIGFCQIAQINDAVLQHSQPQRLDNIADILQVDKQVRQQAQALVEKTRL